jgi:hypothetical protein
METLGERRIPAYKLVLYKSQLRQLQSFSTNVDRCNFTTYCGWRGKTYVDEQGHGVEEHRPALRGVDVLDVYYLKLTDYVVLTEEQYKDYRIVVGDE